MKYIIDYDLEGVTVQEFKNLCSDAPSKKAEISNYLKSFNAWGYTTEPLSDILTGEIIQENGCASYTDGEYEWYDDWIYHFEKYNLKLNDDFIAHVLSKIA